MTSGLTATADQWEVDLRGRVVEMLTIDSRVTLHLHGDTGYDGSIILGMPFSVTTEGNSSIPVDPEEKAKLTPAVECFGKTVAAVSVSRGDGALTLTFTDGTIINAVSHPDYEAWEVNAASIKIVALPGGGEPALWT